MKQIVPDMRDHHGAGPQGSALVLELRRIQEGFDRQVRRQANGSPGRAEGTANAAKRAAKAGPGVIERAVDACLEGLGLGGGPRAAPTGERPDAGRVANLGGSRPAPKALPPRAARSAPVEPTARHRAPAEPIERTGAPVKPIARNRAPVELRAGAPAPRGRNLPVLPAGPPAVRRPQGGGLSARGEAAGRAIVPALRQAKVAWDFLLTNAGGVPVHDAPGDELTSRIGYSFQRELRTGLRVLVFGVGLAVAWATLVPLSAAVIVQGSLIAESNVKKIQHQTGGIVAQIAVRDGMHVREGDLLVRLDETQTRSNLQVVAGQRDQFRARVARLIAERDGAAEIEFPPDLAARKSDSDIEQLLASERTQFKARASSRQNQKDLLRSHVTQLGEQIAGFDAQIKSKADQIDLITGELKGVQGLYEKKLVPLTRLTTLQREAARIEGERGQLVSEIAEAQGKISEAELQIIRVDQDFRTEVTKDLREAQDKEAEFSERSIAARDQLNRIELRAPTSGVIHELAVHTVGGVVTPAEVLMEVVPDSDDLQVEGRLPINEINHVGIGQKAVVKFSAFNQRTTPELNGMVSFVSPDASHDKINNSPFYTVRVTLPGEERRRLGDLQLVSGMPAELFLQTGSRTMMTYLLKPLTDQMRRMFTEN
ncbi:MAG: HlyD family type I secretion periplasmic adaptor subunit [Xanthobacteraceae bacterium]